MKFKGLSERLQKAFDLAIPELDFWDVGCDHGQLGIQAVKSGRFNTVCFVDPAMHMIQKLQTKISEPNAEFFPVEFQNVAKTIEGNLIFLGVGGRTIKKALSEVQLLKAKRLILGPHRDLPEIEELGLENYQLVGKHAVSERGRTRQLYVYDRIAST